MGHTLTITTPPFKTPQDGREVRSALIWEKVKAPTQINLPLSSLRRMSQMGHEISYHQLRTCRLHCPRQLCAMYRLMRRSKSTTRLSKMLGDEFQDLDGLAIDFPCYPAHSWFLRQCFRLN
jgi:hypothetical protein